MDGVTLRSAMRLRRSLCAGRILMRLAGALLMAAAPSVTSAQIGGGYDAFNGAPGARSTAPERKKPRVVRTQPIDLTDDNPLLKPLADVRVEGNGTIPEYVILQKVMTRSGRPASQAQITEDVRALYDTRWFINVTPVYQQTDDGLVLVFRVVEKPVVRSVRFIGNRWWQAGIPRGIKDNKLEAETGLRPGAPFDVTINKEAAERIRELFVEKGYRHVRVDLRKGGDPQDRDVVFVIKPGPKVQVRNVSVEGNRFTRDAVLELGKETKPRWWFPLSFVGGKYDPETIPNDEIAITQYYQGLGFFDVEVKGQYRWVNKQKSLVDVVFKVDEGTRFKVRSIRIDGEQVVPERKLREPLKLVKGEYFNARHLAEDVAGIKTNYDDLGRLFASVNAQPVFLEKPGHLDLVYTIDEDKVYYIGDIHVSIRGDYPHTSEDVIRNMADAYIQPGSLANAANIRKLRARLLGSHLWERTDPPSVDIRKVEGSDYLSVDIIGRAQDAELSTEGLREARAPLTTRGFFGKSEDAGRPAGNSIPPDVRPASHSGETPGSASVQSLEDNPVVRLKPTDFGHSLAKTSPAERPLHGGRAQAPLAALPKPQRAVSTPIHKRDDMNIVMWEFSSPSRVMSDEPDEIIRAQSPDFRAQSMDAFGNPVPQDYLQGVSPQGDPYGNALRGPILPGFVDVDIAVTEARTGRLMFGLGVNSDAGVVGNIVLEENNFDITRPPTSFADLVNGQAWRGGGQSFRIEAVPGSEVSRYLISWQDPFFLNTDFSLGVSGFYYTRFFEDWDEQRLGGRLTLGRLLGNFWSLSGAIRLENVDILDIRTGAPAALTSVRGDNFLSTGRVALAHDTRDSAFLPTQGHFIEGSYEQAFGEFNYPRFEITGSQFFTVYERPDGRGKHILQLRGQAGWTGNDTPIFERFYAGGFQSFRGFEFRGVTPRTAGVKVGGEFLLLGTVEYIVPITANDNIRAVVFSDFGTVEASAGIDQFRASVGTGLRLIVPAMGPAPIALDFAWPVASERFDEEQLFSFYVGFTR